jgi:hypothetical protein
MIWSSAANGVSDATSEGGRRRRGPRVEPTLGWRSRRARRAARSLLCFIPSPGSSAMTPVGSSPLRRVLLVAKNGERLRALADQLWAIDFIAYCARSRGEVLALLRTRTPLDLVLVDSSLGKSFVTSLRDEVSRLCPRLPLQIHRRSINLDLN